jgi:hypothetical protein
MRHITFASDRIPALAGIVSHFEKLLDDRYLHGLWVRDIHRGLLFNLKSWANSAIQPTWMDGPTWSWVTLSSPVSWGTRQWDPEAVEMCKIRVPTAMDNRACRVNGMLVPLRSSEFQDLGFLHFQAPSRAGTRSQGLRITLFPDEWYGHPYRVSYESVPHSPQPRPIDPTYVHRTIALCNDIVLAPIIYYDNFQFLGGAGAWCLMLHVQPGLAKGTYIRVGIGRIATQQGESSGLVKIDRLLDYRNLLCQMREYQEPLLDEWYHETSGAGEYVFSIV